MHGRSPLPFGERVRVRGTCRTDCPLSLEGEGWGEGENAALVVVPFTSGSLLL